MPWLLLLVRYLSICSCCTCDEVVAASRIPKAQLEYCVVVRTHTHTHTRTHASQSYPQHWVVSVRRKKEPTPMWMTFQILPWWCQKNNQRAIFENEKHLKSIDALDCVWSPLPIMSNYNIMISFDKKIIYIEWVLLPVLSLSIALTFLQ